MISRSLHQRYSKSVAAARCREAMPQTAGKHRRLKHHRDVCSDCRPLIATAVQLTSSIIDPLTSIIDIRRPLLLTWHTSWLCTCPLSRCTPTKYKQRPSVHNEKHIGTVPTHHPRKSEPNTCTQCRAHCTSLATTRSLQPWPSWATSCKRCSSSYRPLGHRFGQRHTSATSTL
jgi:hypothetical protein